jgi:hypothetical protein
MTMFWLRRVVNGRKKRPAASVSMRPIAMSEAGCYVVNVFGDYRLTCRKRKRRTMMITESQLIEAYVKYQNELDVAHTIANNLTLARKGLADAERAVILSDKLDGKNETIRKAQLETFVAKERKLVDDLSLQYDVAKQETEKARLDIRKLQDLLALATVAVELQRGKNVVLR